MNNYNVYEYNDIFYRLVKGWDIDNKYQELIPYKDKLSYLFKTHYLKHPGENALYSINDHVKWCFYLIDFLKEDFNNIDNELIDLLSYTEDYYDYLKILIKPEEVSKDLLNYLNIFYDFINTYYYHKFGINTVSNERIRNLLYILDDFHTNRKSNNFYSGWITILLAYSYLNNDYTYFYKYLDNPDYYIEKLNMNTDKLQCNFSDEHINLYNNLDLIFGKNMVLKKKNVL